MISCPSNEGFRLNELKNSGCKEIMIGMWPANSNWSGESILVFNRRFYIFMPVGIISILSMYFDAGISLGRKKCTSLYFDEIKG